MLFLGDNDGRFSMVQASVIITVYVHANGTTSATRILCPHYKPCRDLYYMYD